LQCFCNIISYNIVYRFTSRKKLIIGLYFVCPPRHEINKHSTTTFLQKICFSIFDYAHYTYNIVPILYYYYYYYYYVGRRDRLRWFISDTGVVEVPSQTDKFKEWPFPFAIFQYNCRATFGLTAERNESKNKGLSRWCRTIKYH